MSVLNETSGLSSAKQINDATSIVIFSLNNTSSDIAEIILILPKKEIKKEEEKTPRHSTLSNFNP